MDEIQAAIEIELQDIERFNEHLFRLASTGKITDDDFTILSAYPYRRAAKLKNEIGRNTCETV